MYFKFDLVKLEYEPSDLQLTIKIL